MRSIPRVVLILACVLVPATAYGDAYKTLVPAGSRWIPVIVTEGSAYDRGYGVGKLLAAEARIVYDRLLTETVFNSDSLAKVWDSAKAELGPAYMDEVKGFSDGAGIDYWRVVEANLAFARIGNSGSAGAAVPPLSKGGNAYVARSFDGAMGQAIHDYPCVVISLPTEGAATIVPTFAGIIGAPAAMNAHKLAFVGVSTSGKSLSTRSLAGAPPTMALQKVLSTSTALDDAASALHHAKMPGGNCFLGVDGASKKAIKFKDTARDGQVWTPADPRDDAMPFIQPGVVYFDNGRGLFPFLVALPGLMDGPALISAVERATTPNQNVMNVAFDASNLTMWVAYADKSSQASTQPFAEVKMEEYLPYNPAAHRVTASVVTGWKALIKWAALAAPILLIVIIVVLLRR